MNVRRPSFAGQFYDGRPESLRSQIEGAFRSELGPGRPPSEPGDSETILGIVVPHAGYIYSGPVAAWSYSTLYKDRRPGSFVILGPNHQGMGSGVAMYAQGAWQTPLGTAQIDADLAKAITKETSMVDVDERAHAYEHSIEVQLPFLQYLFGEVKFVPISMMMQDLDTSLEVGRDICKAIAATGKKSAIVASTDFSHYVAPDVAHEKDHAAIDRILAMDASGLYKVVEERRISMCGFGPVMAAIEATSKLGATKGELLKYATSGDVMPMRDVVGYAALALRKS